MSTTKSSTTQMQTCPRKKNTNETTEELPSDDQNINSKEGEEILSPDGPAFAPVASCRESTNSKL